MSARAWLGLNVTPLLLRLSLGTVFIWAGYGKLAYNDPFQGEEAAVLANLGVVRPFAPPASPAPSPPDEAAPPETPTTPPAENPRPQSRTGASGVRIVRVAVEESQPGEAAKTTSASPPAYVAADFPDPVKAPRLYNVAVLLHRASHPEDPAKQLWPTKLASPRVIIAIAWAAALTEALGGAFVLVGFLTRLAALGLASTMAAAMLLTTIGPAAVSGSAFLGFLPDPMMDDPQRWGQAWNTLLFQFTLLTAAMGVFFCGAGAFSVDRILFGGAAGPRQNAPAKS